MKIYIPKHLREVEVIDQLYRMIEAYGQEYSDITTDSFGEYQVSQTSDPVKKFLELCISEDSIGEGQDYSEVINYLSKLFYSVKGTIKIFDYMAKFLNLNLDGEILYDSREITLNFINLNVSNEALFYNLLRDFLDALILYTRLNTNIDVVNLNIKNDFTAFVGGSLRSYKKIEVEPYEINYWQ